MGRGLNAFSGLTRSSLKLSRAIRKDFEPWNKLIKDIHKQEEREREIKYAFQKYKEYDDLVKKITNLHLRFSKEKDWNSLYNCPPPEVPIRKNTNQEKATKFYENYRPSLFYKIFNLVERKKSKLVRKIEEAKEMDEKIHLERKKNYENKFIEWEINKELAKNVLAGELSAYQKVIEEFNPFKDINAVQWEIEFTIVDAKNLKLIIIPNAKENIPKESVSLLKSGRVSIKEISFSRHNELKRDYICCLIIRVARETFAVLPVETLYITVKDQILDYSLGNSAIHVIISLVITKEVMNKINIENILPYEALSNFQCILNYKKRNGFSAIPLNLCYTTINKSKNNMFKLSL